MKPGDVALIALPDMAGKLKLRPALVLALLPVPQSLRAILISRPAVCIRIP